MARVDHAMRSKGAYGTAGEGKSVTGQRSADDGKSDFVVIEFLKHGLFLLCIPKTPSGLIRNTLRRFERLSSLSRWVLYSSHLLPWSARRFRPALLCRSRLRLCVTSSLFSNAAHRAVCT
jgi:hypothetical protein